MKKMKFSGQSGLTAYAVISDLNDKFFNGTGLETFSAGSYLNYGFLMTEIGTTGIYSRDVPAALPPGKYLFTYKHRAGASFAQSDDVIFQMISAYDGADLVDELVIGASVVNICNMALAHLGVGVLITDLENERSAEAGACRTFYETARDATLRDFPWGFAKRYTALSLVSEDPVGEWKYSYRYPGNALYLVRVVQDIRNAREDQKIPFHVVGDEFGRLIYTDREDADIEYVARVENPLRFTPDFVLAISWRLAVYIAPKVTSGDPFKLKQDALNMYALEIRKAYELSANEERRDPAPESSLYQARL